MKPPSPQARISQIHVRSQILAWTTTLRVGWRRRRLLHERVPEHLEERGPLPECADDEGSQRLRGQSIHKEGTSGLQPCFARRGGAVLEDFGREVVDSLPSLERSRRFVLMRSAVPGCVESHSVAPVPPSSLRKKLCMAREWQPRPSRAVAAHRYHPSSSASNSLVRLYVIELSADACWRRRPAVSTPNPSTWPSLSASPDKRAERSTLPRRCRTIRFWAVPMKDVPHLMADDCE